MSFISQNPIDFVLLYFARILLISGFLFGYYQLCLRNAPFHGYNRFFLLGITALSFLLPILPLPGVDLFGGNGGHNGATGILHAITTGNWEESVDLTGHPALLHRFPGGQELLVGAYLLITLVFLAAPALSLLHIFRLSSRCPQQRAGGIRIFMTDEPGTPFSFLNRIFWNNQLDINSSTGRQIFRHELYHVRKKHTADLLALEIIRAVCRWNPFFHLIRKEIKATHEFLADRYAIGTSDKYEYAELLVWQSVGNADPIVHSFFNTHLKRRITMLTRSTNTKPGYFNRIMVLPLLLLLFCAFATRLQKMDHALNSLPAKTITVVIDAGHGGSDDGTHSADLKEKDLNLAIAKKVQQLATSYNINVLMTREEDQLPGNSTTISEGLNYRIDFANEHKADLFISIHVNAGGKKGMEVYLSPQNAFFQKSISLGSAMIEEMKKVYPTHEELEQQRTGVRVLEKTRMPAILVECGYMDDATDLAFISKEANQAMVARSLLQGILRYEEGLAAAPINSPSNDIASPAPAPPPPAAPVPAVQ
jgi:N-acetylmuramoyl-L-alanine amidase